MDLTRYKEKLTRIIDPFVYIYITSFFILSHAIMGTEKYSNFIALMLMGLLAVYSLYGLKNYVSYYVMAGALFVGYGFLSSLWALDGPETIVRMMSVLKLFVLTSLLFNYCVSEKKSDLIFKAIYVAGVMYACFYILYYSPSYIIRFMKTSFVGGDRMGYTLGNSNSLSVQCAFAALIGLYYIIFEKQWANIFPIALCGVVVISTASRTGLFVAVAGLFLLIFFRGRGRGKLISLAVIAGLVGLMFLVAQLPMFRPFYEKIIAGVKGLLKGGDTDYSTGTRLVMIRAAWDCFKQSPLLGIGMGSSGLIVYGLFEDKSYFHNNFAEVLAGGGLVGFILYYYWYLSGAVRGLLKNKDDNLVLLSFVLILVGLLSHMGSVTYYDKLSAMLVLGSHVVASLSDRK